MIEEVPKQDEFNIDDDNYIGYLEKLMEKIPNSFEPKKNHLTKTQFPTQFTIQCTCTEILSVDDEIFNQTALRGLLKKLGFYVEVAYNGQQAIEKLLAKPQCCVVCKKYVLILMDCQMPIMDGWETTRRMVKMMLINEIFEIPIIGLTAFNNNKDIQECFNAGMKEVLSKPLNILKFKKILTQYGIRQPTQQ